MGIATALILFIWCLFVNKLGANFRKIPKITPSDRLPEGIKFTVLLPVRNEEANIIRLLYDLQAQTFPANRFEVLVLNDNSDDRTAELAADFKAAFALRVVNIVHAEGTVAFKKSSLIQGVDLARYPYIACTDGDCRLGPDWLLSIAEGFNQDAVFLSGPVALSPARNLWERMQQQEFCTLVGSGAALLQSGMPSMCNGANIAYKKQAFEKVGGYAGNLHIPSGDDEFLMHKLAEAYPERVRFLRSPESLVTTNPASDISVFFAQRRRWAGKWNSYKNTKVSLLAAGVFGLNAFVLYAFYLCTLAAKETCFGALHASGTGGTSVTGYLLFGLFMKAASEAEFIRQVYTDLKIGESETEMQTDTFLKKGTAFLLLQIVHPFYVVFFGISGGLIKGYRWKGRKIN